MRKHKHQSTKHLTQRHRISCSWPQHTPFRLATNLSLLWSGIPFVQSR